MKCVYSAALLALAASSLVAAQHCGSFRDPRERSSIDFAPLDGYTDVCSRDFQLCVMLTLGYPSSVQTIAYFVPNAEWQKYKEGKHKGFSRYLIAQHAVRTLSSEEFADFKDYVRSQQGNVVDHSKVPSLFEVKGRVPLGVVDESADSISYGTVIKLEQKDQGEGGSELLGAINIALQLKGESLSLYVFDVVKDLHDTDRLKALARHWLQCIRNQNK